MRPEPAARVWNDVRPLLLLFLVGCWTTSRGPAALLRRSHVAGDMTRMCVSGNIAVGSKFEMILRQVLDQTTVSVTDGRFEVRERMGGDVTIDREVKPQPPVYGGAVFFDARNRASGGKLYPTAYIGEGAEQVRAPSFAEITSLIFPERALREGDEFALETSQATTDDAAEPAQFVLEVRFRVTKIEPDFIELACSGTQRERVRAGTASAESRLALRCKARISRRDGRTGAWELTSQGTYSKRGAVMVTTSLLFVDIGPRDTCRDPDPIVAPPRLTTAWGPR